MSFLTLKRKIENETRRFNPAWTDKYLFILPPNASAKPMCLLCNECVAMFKDYNVRRHHFEKRRTFQTNFPEGSQERAAKVQSLIASYNRSCTTMVRSCTAQERATAASLRVSWILVMNDEKIKTSVTSAIKNVPLSDTSNIRRIEILATNMFETLLEELKKADVMSIAVYESTDKTDTAQLCIYVRVFDGKCFREELLGLLPLEGHTTGKIVFGKISAFFKDNGLDMELNVWQHVGPLFGELKTTIDSVMATINFIHSTSSLHHRLFRKLLSNMSAEHRDLLLHNDVRWLSKGKALERCCDLNEEIATFLRSTKLKKAETHLNRILDNNFMADVCFLSDIFKHLNDLNEGLQGRDKTVTDHLEQMRAFQVKLDFFATDLSTGRMHFPTLRKHISSPAQITVVMTDFIERLKENFSSITKAQELHTNGPAKFWSDINVHQFPNVKKLAIIVLSMFGSTYTCESSFSHMNSTKSSSRCSLTDNTLHQCLRIALTSYEPKVTALEKKNYKKNNPKV
uniref:HAT C-terminal dimerisation domain-containing protein n=1 Tax=Labrus bergylta TaxID=56723 RepID=A0A3Q3EAD9_9LABR